MLLFKHYFRLYWKLVSWGMLLLISCKTKFKMFSLLYLGGGGGSYINVTDVLFRVMLIDCFAKEEECCS